jgi:hypothetical protein
LSEQSAAKYLPKVYFVNHLALVGQIPRTASTSQGLQTQSFSNPSSPESPQDYAPRDLQSGEALVVPLPEVSQQHMHYSDLEQLVGEVFRAAAELEETDSSLEDSDSA